MPNHCENDLYVHGRSDDVAAVLALIGADKAEPEFNFDAVIPYPERFAEMDAEMRVIREKSEWHRADSPELAAYREKWGTDKDGFSSGGYEWRCEHQGTKWGAYEVKRRDYECVCITFQTAWSPPKPVIVALAKRFPKVTFRIEWFERGMAFCGGFSCLSDSDADDHDQERGTISDAWEGKYLGHRGG